MIYFAQTIVDQKPAPDHDLLLEVAESHAGYFTTVQARSVGFRAPLSLTMLGAASSNGSGQAPTG